VFQFAIVKPNSCGPNTSQAATVELSICSIIFSIESIEPEKLVHVEAYLNQCRSTPEWKNAIKVPENNIKNDDVNKKLFLILGFAKNNNELPNKAK